MKFRNATITNVGKTILTSATFLNRIKFTRFVFSSSSNPVSESSTSLESPTWGDGTVNNYAINSNGDFVLYASASTENGGGYTYSYGVYARLENTPESAADTLVFVANCEDDPVYFSQTDSAHTRLLLALTVHFAIDENAIVLEPSIAGAASAKALQDLEDRVVTTHTAANELVGDDQTVRGDKTFVDTIAVTNDNIFVEFNGDNGDIALVGRQQSSQNTLNELGGSPQAWLDIQVYEDGDNSAKMLTIGSMVDGRKSVIELIPSDFVANTPKSTTQITSDKIILTGSTEVHGSMSAYGDILPIATTINIGSELKPFRNIYCGSLNINNEISLNDFAYLSEVGIQVPDADSNFSIGENGKPIGDIFATDVHCRDVQSEQMSTERALFDYLGAQTINAGTVNCSGILQGKYVNATSTLRANQLAIDDIATIKSLHISDIPITANGNTLTIGTQAYDFKVIMNNASIATLGAYNFTTRYAQTNNITTQFLNGEPITLKQTIVLHSDNKQPPYTVVHAGGTNNPVEVTSSGTGGYPHVLIKIKKNELLDPNNMACWDVLDSIESKTTPDTLANWMCGIMTIKTVSLTSNSAGGLVYNEMNFTDPVSIFKNPAGELVVIKCDTANGSARKVEFPILMENVQANLYYGYVVDIELKLFNNPVRLPNIYQI